MMNWKKLTIQIVGLASLLALPLGAQAQVGTGVDTQSATPMPPVVTPPPRGTSYSADNDDSDNSRDLPFGQSNGVGAVLGTSSGIGIGYRLFFEDGWGFQVAGIPYGDRDSFHMNLGIQGMKVLSQNRNKHLRLYGLAGTSGFYDATKKGEEWDHGGRWFVGAGFGLEFLWPNLGLSVELPMVLNFDLDNGTSFESIYPIPAAALIYYF